MGARSASANRATTTKRSAFREGRAPSRPQARGTRAPTRCVSTNNMQPARFADAPWRKSRGRRHWPRLMVRLAGTTNASLVGEARTAAPSANEKAESCLGQFRHDALVRCGSTVPRYLDEVPASVDVPCADFVCTTEAPGARNIYGTVRIPLGGAGISTANRRAETRTANRQTNVFMPRPFHGQTIL